MKRLKTLGKLQECFLNACEKVMLILPLDSAKIYPTSLIILVCLSEKNLERVKGHVDITDFQQNANNNYVSISGYIIPLFSY